MRRFYKLVSQFLVVFLVWTPFSIQASLIGTDQVAASAHDELNRSKVAEFVQRAEVARQLELFGISSANAKERVDAMTQEEINRIAGEIETLPAGADAAGWLIVAAIIAAAIWYLWYRR